jgi:ethanolamine transporter EutH
LGNVKVRDIAFAVVVAVAVGGGVGLAVGFAARHFGWPTGFVGPLTGGIVSALTIAIYQVRTGRSGRGKP